MMGIDGRDELHTAVVGQFGTYDEIAADAYLTWVERSHAELREWLSIQHGIMLLGDHECGDWCPLLKVLARSEWHGGRDGELPPVPERA